MFTGLIANMGWVEERTDLPGGGATLRIAVPPALMRDGIEVKDSICVSGVCLTAVTVHDDGFTCDVVPETLRRSALGELRADDNVNLELSLRLGDRLGGHLVYGHVDAAARLIDRIAEGQGSRLRMEVPAPLRELIVHKGYIAVDGVSLTVAAVNGPVFEIALIPETARRTTLGAKPPGALVSLEADPIARYALAGLRAYSA